MAKFWNSKTFIKLDKEWKTKLKRSGFVDSELDSKGDQNLKGYCRVSQLERESRLGYYLLLGSLVERENYKNRLEERIMLSHAHGKTIKEIVQELSQKGISRDRKTVRFIIRRWQMKWGIRHWTLKQLNLKKPIP